MQKAIHDPAFALYSPLSSLEPQDKGAWDVVKSEGIARVVAIFASVFAAVDALVHFLAGTYKGISLLTRKVCCLDYSSFNTSDIYAHFQRASWFVLVTIIGSAVSVILPSAFSPSSIAHCSMREAVFSSADQAKPVIATDSLSTCVGVAGYDRTHKLGFVVHFPTETEVETNGDEILKTMQNLVKGEIRSPVEIHLRGGISGLSEPCVNAIKKWVSSSAEKGCPMQIVSEKTLLIELTSMCSLALDTRNGAISSYDREKDRHAISKKKIKNQAEFDSILTEVMMQEISAGSKIKIITPLNRRSSALSAT